MENELRAPRAGRVETVHVEPARRSSATIRSFRWPRLTTNEARRVASHQPGEGRRRAGRAPRAVRHDLGHRGRRPLHGRRSGRLGRGHGARPAGRVPVHARRPADDVSRPAVDDAPVRRLRQRRRDQPPLPLPARPRPDRLVGGLRPADADGLRRRRIGRGRGGRPGRRADQLDRRHARLARRPAAGRGDDVDDDQRHRRHPAGLLRRRRRRARHPARQARRHRPERHPEGVHRARHVHLPDGRLDAPGYRRLRVLRARTAALEHDLDQRLPHARGGRDAPPRSWPSRSPTASPTSRRRVRVGSTSTPSPAGCRSSSPPGASCSRKWPSSAPRAACGRGSCATALARPTHAR